MCLRKFRVSKKFMPKTGKSRFSLENLLSHSTNKLCRGTLLSSKKILVAEKFKDKRGGREGVTRFSVKHFLSHW